MSFHQIRSRERTKYKTVIHRSVRFDWFTTEQIQRNIAMAFCVVNRNVIRKQHILMDRYIIPGVFQHSYQKREAKIVE